jgi:glyoxylase-like metal-dependent hydrolase (beta-lactamase superfamily II)
VFGGQQQATYVHGDRAWSVTPTGANPQPTQAEFRQLQIWLTPHGFLRAARQSKDATLSTDASGASVITFTNGSSKITGTLTNDLVTKVATTVPDPVLGDTELTATYANYKAFGAIQAPTKIVQTQGGFPLWEVSVTNVQANPATDLAIPESVAAAPAGLPPVSVISTRLAPGVWYLTGGSHHSLAVEFPEYVAVVEAPQSAARSTAVIDEIHKVIPGKPINYVISTHHHFDHAGGLATYVAEGATVVTHSSNKAFFEKAFAAQKAALKKAKIEPVGEKWVLKGGPQTLEVYSTHGDDHTDELLIAYLPATGILMEADSWSPAAVPTPGSAEALTPPPPPTPNALALWDNIERLKLNVRTIAPVHGRGAAPFAEFARAVGK